MEATRGARPSERGDSEFGASMEAKLVVVGGRVTKNSVSLELPTILGRGREAKLRIGDSTISRKHCQMYEKDGLVMIQDLGSLNGTVVHGHTVKEAPLPPGAEFTIGPLTFRIEYEYHGDLSALPEVVPAEDAAAMAETADFQAVAPAALNTLETGPSASNSDDFAILNASTHPATSGSNPLDSELAVAMTEPDEPGEDSEGPSPKVRKS
jgi:predicted component of type VI protein secretion system